MNSNQGEIQSENNQVSQNISSNATHQRFPSESSILDEPIDVPQQGIDFNQEDQNENGFDDRNYANFPTNSSKFADQMNSSGLGQLNNNTTFDQELATQIQPIANSSEIDIQLDMNTATSNQGANLSVEEQENARRLRVLGKRSR